MIGRSDLCGKRGDRRGDEIEREVVGIDTCRRDAHTIGSNSIETGGNVFSGICWYASLFGSRAMMVVSGGEEAFAIVIGGSDRRCMGESIPSG